MQCLSGKHPQPPTLDHAVCHDCAAPAGRALLGKDLDQGYEFVPWRPSRGVSALLTFAVYTCLIVALPVVDYLLWPRDTQLTPAEEREVDRLRWRRERGMK